MNEPSNKTPPPSGTLVHNRPADSQSVSNSFLQLKELMLGDEQREIEALRQRLLENESALTSLKNTLANRSQELSHLLTQHHSLLENLRLDLDSGTSHAGQLREDLDSNKREIESLHEDSHHAQSERNFLSKSLSSEVSRLDQQNQTQQTNLANLRHDLTQTNQNLDTLRAEATQSSAAQQNALETLKADLTAQSKQLSTKILSLRDDTSQSASSHQQVLETLQSHLTQTNADLNSLGEQLKSQLENLQQDSSKTTSSHLARLDTLQTHLDTTSSNLSSLSEQSQEHNTQLTSLRNDLTSSQETSRQHADSTSQTFSQVHENLSSLQQQIDFEQTALQQLRNHFEQVEAASVERLAQNLAAALDLQKSTSPAAFNQLVAALQPGTESAIQRSVSSNKEPLTKALFPIMGPAIRNYVTDLFRSMAEELNRSIQNATSLERIRWRAQAKMAGKPYSEYVLLKTRSFQVEEAYLMQRDTGLLLLHTAANPANESSGEADLVSGMFTAIRSFVKDSFSRSPSHEELDRFNFGEREVLIEAGPSLVLAAVVHGVPTPSVREELKVILEQLHIDLHPHLTHFSGDTSELEGFRPTLRRALIQHTAEKEDTSSGGGLWRLWLALGILTLALGTWAFFNIREQQNWHKFETALRSTPGITVTEIKNTRWGNKRTVRGLRDPLAAEPVSLAAEHNINLDRTQFLFDPVESLDPTFLASRSTPDTKAISLLTTQIESLQQELSSLRQSQSTSQEQLSQQSQLATQSLVQSLFSDIPNLTLSFTENTLTLSGDLTAENLALTKLRAQDLSSLLTVDTSGLSNDTSARISSLTQAIESTFIKYQQASLDQENTRLVFQLASQLKELSQLTPATFTIQSHPLIGTNREANRLIERRRAEQALEQLLALDIPLKSLNARLSEDLSQAGNGINILVNPP